MRRIYGVSYFVLGHFDGLPLVEAGDEVDFLIFMLEVIFEEQAPLDMEFLKQVLPLLVVKIFHAA